VNVLRRWATGRRSDIVDLCGENDARADVNPAPTASSDHRDH
jgi:hypothetical protein